MLLRTGSDHIFVKSLANAALFRELRLPFLGTSQYLLDSAVPLPAAPPRAGAAAAASVRGRRPSMRYFATATDHRPTARSGDFCAAKCGCDSRGEGHELAIVDVEAFHHDTVWRRSRRSPHGHGRHHTCSWSSFGEPSLVDAYVAGASAGQVEPRQDCGRRDARQTAGL
jgi:hypothetical protein